MTDRAPVVCIVTVRNILRDHAGRSAYLNAFAAMLAEQGASVRYLSMEPFSPTALRATTPESLQRPYDLMAQRGAIRIGRWFYAASPRNWALRAARMAGLSPRRAPAPPAPADGGLWRLDPPDPEGVAWAGRALARMRPDVVVANYFNAAAVFDAAPAGARRAILVHDVLTLRARSLRAAGATLDFDPAMMTAETDAFRRAQICFAIQGREAAHIREVAPDVDVRLAPYGVRIPEDDLDAPRPPVCLFVASDTAANRDGLSWLLDDIWPQVRARRPDARLRVVGTVGAAAPEPWPAGAERAGYVASLDEAYRGAAVALTPLRFGSGLKIKLVEGLAAGLPVVATPTGAEGVEGAPRRVLRVERGADAFAAAVVETLAEADATTRADARAFAAAHYDRRRIGAALMAALR